MNPTSQDCTVLNYQLKPATSAAPLENIIDKMVRGGMQAWGESRNAGWYHSKCNNCGVQMGLAFKPDAAATQLEKLTVYCGCPAAHVLISLGLTDADVVDGGR